MLNDGAEVIEGGDVVAVAGKGLVLECWVQGGKPPPALRLTVGGVLRKQAKEHMETEAGVTVSKLSLQLERTDQGKTARCEVVHPALEGTKLLQAGLQIQYSQLVSVTPAQPFSVEGDSVEIQCSTEAVPAASVIWYRAGSGEIVSRYGVSISHSHLLSFF